MKVLRHVSIEGLWGKRDLDFDFSPSVNFIVGPNGSGKTAVIRLIAAALAVNPNVLKNDEFFKINLTLIDSKTKERTAINVEKSPDDRAGFKYQLDGSDIVQVRPYASLLAGRTSYVDSVRTVIEAHYRLTWLPVHREKMAAARLRPASLFEERSEGPPIDQTVVSLSESLSRYFSELNSRAEALLEDFVSHVFATLLPSGSTMSRGLLARHEELEADQAAYEKILKNFGVAEEAPYKTMRDFFMRAEKTRDQMKENDSSDSIEFDDFLAVAYLSTVQRIVEKWNEVSLKRDLVYVWQSKFEALLNELLYKKYVSVNKQNELEIRVQDNERRLPIAALSSGEKQLFIMLGEALLQQLHPYIYIADEPELSLHIAWQEKLIQSILQLNPSAQIIFATHSPDVIGTYRGSIWDLSKS